MLFSWLKNRRRRRLLAQPFPTLWLDVLQENVALYARMIEPERARLRDVVRVLVSEKEWIGSKNFEVTDRMKVVVAAQAAILVLGLEDFWFDNVTSILLRRRGYKTKRRHSLGGEAYLESEEPLLGEAHYNGPLILAWREVDDAARRPGYGENLIYHEFAHKLDQLTGYADGTPPLPWSLQARWEKTLKAEFEALVHATEWDQETVLDPYGATDPAEFFAVATETFFDNPLDLRRQHPELFDLFREFYRQNPCHWFE